MIHFPYGAIHTAIQDKILSNHDMFEKYFENDCQWLHDNDIDFQVDVFHWPEMPFFTQHQIAKVRTEITIVIKNREQAAVFRLYSGLVGE